MTLTSEYGLWWELILVLATGTTVIVGLAALAGRLVRSALWQRTFWQVAVLALSTMVIIESTGTAPGLVRLCRVKVYASTKSIDVSGPVQPPQSSPAAVPVSWAGRDFSAESDYPAGAEYRAGRDFLAAPGSHRANECFAAEKHIHAKHHDPAPGAAQFGASWPGRRSVGDEHASPVGGAVTACSPSVTVLQANSPEVWWPAVVWALVAAVLAVWIVWARLVLSLFRRRHTAVANQVLRRRVDTLARRLGIRQPVRVLQAPGLATPVAFGSLRPTLALPTRFVDDFDPAQQEAILAHELAHLAAGDPTWQLVADLACAVLWWHPLAWWSRGGLWAASEAAADEASLLVPDGPNTLADCLVALGRGLAHPRRLAWMPVEGPRFRSNLGRRVQRLLGLSARPWRAPRRGVQLFVKTALPAALVILAVSCTAWARPQALLSEGGTTMNVLQSSWRRSLAGVALAAFLGPFSGDAISQEAEGEGAKSIAVREDRPDQGPSSRPTEREPGERQRDEGEQPERGERPTERQVLIDQVEVLRIALHALREAERRDAVELLERAIRAREVTLEGRRDDEAHLIRQRAPSRSQLAEILTMAAGLWREFGNQQKAAAVAGLAEEFVRPGDREPERPVRDRERRDVERPDRPRPERWKAELIEKRRELDEEAGRIKRAIAERAQDEETEELEREFDRIHKERLEIERELAEVGDRPKRLAERSKELREAIFRAREAGRGEEVERLQREWREIMQELGGPPARPPRPTPVAEEIMRRLEELKGSFGPSHPKVRAETERLRAEQARARALAEEQRADAAWEARRELEEQARDIERRLHELRDDQDEEARRLQDELRRIQEQLRRLQPERPDRPPAREELVRRYLEELERALVRGREAEVQGRGRRQPPPTAAIPPLLHEELKELQGIVRELHGQVQELRREVAEMRQRLQRVVEHEGREDERHEDEEDDG